MHILFKRYVQHSIIGVGQKNFLNENILDNYDNKSIVVSNKTPTSAANNDLIPPKHAIKLMNSANLEPPPELQSKESLTYFDSSSFNQTSTKTFREIFFSKPNNTEESNGFKSSVYRKTSPKNLFDQSCGSKTSRSVKSINTNLLERSGT